MANTKNKELRAYYNKKYYEANYEKIYNHLKEERFCQCCNRYYQLYLISKHNQTKKHLKNRDIYNSIEKNANSNSRI